WWAQLADGGLLLVPLRMRGLTRTVALERDGAILRSRSVEVCGFIPMRGVGAVAEQNVRVGGREGDLLLRIDDGQPIDAEAVAGALDHPGQVGRRGPRRRGPGSGPDRLRVGARGGLAQRLEDRRLSSDQRRRVPRQVAHLVIGVDVEGRKHALGVWIAEAEGAKFWLSVLTQLRNRGLRDILICCCDGLSGLPEAITTAFPDTVVQTCVVHVIRNAMKFVSYQDRKKVAAGMRAIYTAPSLEAAEVEFKNFETDFGEQYPGSVDVWRRAWNEFIPFLDYPAELRRIVYTTNAIVILSRLWAVLDVVDERGRSRVLRGGRGYLPSSSTRCLGRFDARSASGDAVVAA
ncbi:MAG: IS256 family transposase, partial [Pseudonocardiaceae bacterium]